MAKPNVSMEVKFPELERLKAAFKDLRPSLARKYMGSAIRKSIKPGLAALRQTTPKGPTGNLRRAITSKVKTYKQGNAVGLVGYIAASGGKSTAYASKGTVRKGRNLGYHMGFLEFGTKDRRTKGPIASSFNKFGPFKIKPIATRGKFKGLARVQTSPSYPRAFFKRAPRGQGVYLGSMPIGGKLGQPPVKTAYQRSLPEMRAQMPINMTLALNNALKDLADKFPRKASANPVTPF